MHFAKTILSTTGTILALLLLTRFRNTNTVSGREMLGETEFAILRQDLANIGKSLKEIVNANFRQSTANVAKRICLMLGDISNMEFRKSTFVKTISPVPLDGRRLDEPQLMS